MGIEGPCAGPLRLNTASILKSSRFAAAVAWSRCRGTEPPSTLDKDDVLNYTRPQPLACPKPVRPPARLLCSCSCPLAPPARPLLAPPNGTRPAAAFGCNGAPFPGPCNRCTFPLLWTRRHWLSRGVRGMSRCRVQAASFALKVRANPNVKSVGGGWGAKPPPFPLGFGEGLGRLELQSLRFPARPGPDLCIISTGLLCTSKLLTRSVSVHPKTSNFRPP